MTLKTHRTARLVFAECFTNPRPQRLDFSCGTYAGADLFRRALNPFQRFAGSEPEKINSAIDLVECVGFVWFPIADCILAGIAPGSPAGPGESALAQTGVGGAHHIDQ